MENPLRLGPNSSLYVVCVRGLDELNQESLPRDGYAISDSTSIFYCRPSSLGAAVI